LRLAKRYSIGYLVLIKRQQPYARHKSYDRLADGEFPAWLDRISYDGNLLIGRFRPGALPTPH
jgi:hypothetical protein